MAISQDDPALCGLAWATKVVASGVFHTGRAPHDVFRESCNWMAASDAVMRRARIDRDPRDLLALRPVFHVDATQGLVTAQLDGRTAHARLNGDQGVMVAHGASAQPHFTPQPVVRTPGDASLGDPDPGHSGTDRAMIAEAVDLAFSNPRQMTNAFMVLRGGVVLAEHYRAPFSSQTLFESWSMGKTIAATLVGVAIRQGLIDLGEPTGFEAWSTPGDPRGAIRVGNLLNMASGLAFTGSYGRGEDENAKEKDGRFLDHIYVYAGGVNSLSFCLDKPLQDTPGTSGRYRNCDPLLATALVRERACGGAIEPFLTWPQRHLFEPIGASQMLLETDPYGHFLISGHDYGRARDWARLGQLHLQKGAWEGRQVFDEAFADFVRTPAADSWADDPTYGGFVYINATGHFSGLPRDAFIMSGGGRQRVVVVPSLDLVMVRLGHINGVAAGLDETLNRVMRLVVQAVS
jgi:CubicO group peptidase (beta-lactamase class C family)